MRSDDDEHLESAEHRRLRRQQAHHHAERAVPAERREAGEALGDDRRGVELSARAFGALARG